MMPTYSNTIKYKDKFDTFFGCDDFIKRPEEDPGDTKFRKAKA